MFWQIGRELKINFVLGLQVVRKVACQSFGKSEFTLIRAWGGHGVAKPSPEDLIARHNALEGGVPLFKVEVDYISRKSNSTFC